MDSISDLFPDTGNAYKWAHRFVWLWLGASLSNYLGLGHEYKITSYFSVRLYFHTIILTTILLHRRWRQSRMVNYYTFHIVINLRCLGLSQSRIVKDAIDCLHIQYQKFEGENVIPEFIYVIMAPTYRCSWRCDFQYSLLISDSDLYGSCDVFNYLLNSGLVTLTPRDTNFYPVLTFQVHVPYIHEIDIKFVFRSPSALLPEILVNTVLAARIDLSSVSLLFN